MRRASRWGAFMSVCDVRNCSLDEYAIRKKKIKSKTTDLNTKTSETVGKTNETNTQKPKTVYESVNIDKVIIEDWNSDDEDDVSESQEPKLKIMVNTGPRVDKPVWDNTKRVNHQKISKYPHLRKTFVPSRVLTITCLITPVKQDEKRAVHTISTARLVSTARPVSTVRPFAPKIAQTGGAIRPIYLRMDNVRPRGSYSPIKRSYYTKPAFRPKDLKQDVKTFGVQNMTTAGTRAVVNTGKGKMDTDLKKSRWVWRPKGNYLDHVSKDSGSFMLKKGNPEILLQDHAVVDSGCSSHMTGNKAYLSDYEDYNGGFVAFGSDPKGGKITGKGKIRTANLDFDDVYFVDELKFNLFSVSQMCDKKNSVLFTETECLILSPSFKLLDESQVVLRAPRKDDVYSLDLKNIVPSGGITCLYANATADESKLWHRRLGHVNFKNINKLVKGHLVRGRGLPLKVFVNDHTCVACKKGKQHKASCKAKLDRIIRKPLELLHIGRIYDMSIVYSINKKRTRIPIKDVVQDAQEQPSENTSPDKDIQDSEDVIDKEGQHQMQEDEQVLQDELEMMVTQELVANAMNDVSRQAFEEEKRRIAFKEDAQATRNNKLSTDRPSISTDRSNTPNVSAASTPTDANVGESSFEVEAMQEDLLQFKLQKVWVLVDLPYGKKVIGTKGVFRNKRDEISIVVKNKARLVAQGFRQEEGIDMIVCIFSMATIEKSVFSSPSQLCYLAHSTKVYKVTKLLRTATTPIESNKPLVKDEDGVDVDVHVYRSMIGSLMYLTASRPDIMFAVYACARFQVTPKASHLNAVKRIFRYLKHQPKLGLWYPRDSPFELEAYSDSDYGGASLDRKSTTEYVAATNFCRQVLWIQNQMMDYGFNFMNTKIHIDNESTISVIKNPVAHSRTKHIEIRFHFIRDCYEKRLIDVIKIHTDHNVADLLTKGFDVTSYYQARYHIANAKVLDKHNIVSFLKKPNESVGFTEVVDFLKTLREIPNTEVFIVRSKLQLADATGIHNLSDAEIYAGLATLGPKSGGWDQFGSTIATALICLSSIGAAVDQGNTSGSAEDSMQLKELMDIVPKEAQEEDISPTILEVAKTLSKVAYQGVSKKRLNSWVVKINTGIEEVSTGSTKVDSGTASKRGQREGKAPMVEEDIQATHKTKEQIRQEEAGLEEAIKLQAQMDEEVAKQIHLDKMIAKRMAEEEALSEQQKKRKAQIKFEA
ncbi:ribonuclease H-like domain-containing protein [Tanacetum coccineum]